MKKKNDILKSDIGQWLEDTSSPTNIEIQQTEDAILRFVAAHAVSPDPKLKNKILDKIKSLDSNKRNRETLNLDNLPILDKTSNWMDWKEVVEGINPPKDFDGIYLHSLESSPQRELFVAWVKEYIAEEVHTDIVESFILLEGTCECHITDAQGSSHLVRMAAGDFIMMNTGETHDVIITSLEPAKAILQWMKLSA
ncbi:MAG: cupin domain-containing protein [Saprospiraceae bacterium]